MMPELPGYGDIRRPGVFEQLVHDVYRLVELNPVPWDGVSFDRSDVVCRCLPAADPILTTETLSQAERALVAIHGAVYDIYADAKGAKTWCCKSLANINYVHYIEQYFGDPKYIYLCRDGRDVAVSFRKAVVGEKNFYHIAREWAATQELALKLRNQIDPNRFMSVSYEELTKSPEETGKKLCAFIGVSYQHQMLNYSRTGEAEQTVGS